MRLCFVKVSLTVLHHPSTTMKQDHRATADITAKVTKMLKKLMTDEKLRWRPRKRPHKSKI